MSELIRGIKSGGTGQSTIAGCKAIFGKTGAEIKTAYEGESDTNPYTDTEQTKLAGIATSKLDATAAPAVTDDATAGYAIGSRWINVTADKEYVCLDSTDGAAVWTETTGAGGSGSGTDVQVDTGGNLAAVDFQDGGDINFAEAAGVVTAAVKMSAITYDKIQDVSATDRILGRYTAGTGVIEEITPANVKVMLAIDSADISDVSASTVDQDRANHTGTQAESTIIGFRLLKSATIIDPVATDDATIWFTPVAVTVGAAHSHITGTTNVVFNINHATTRDGTGLNVFTSDITLTSTSGQTNSTGFNDATIPANSWVWLNVVSVSGTPTMFHVTMELTED